MSELAQYGTTVAGSVTAAVIFGVAWCVRNKCKHSRCAVDSGCLKFSADDKDTIRERPGGEAHHDPPGIEIMSVV